MAIHHATLKKAQKLGIIVTGENGEFEAHHPATNRRVTASTAPHAVACCALQARFAPEYPGIEVAEDQVTLGEIEMELEEGFDIDDAFASFLDMCTEAGVDPSGNGEEEEDEEEHGSIVPDKYKEEYAARGDVNHCGDWLALTLKGHFEVKGETGRPTFNSYAFADFLVANGVDMNGRWASLLHSDDPSAKGRFRMNGRQKLEKRLVETEVLVLGDNKIKVDPEWLAAMRVRHPATKPKKTKPQKAIHKVA